ncbi:hypothetical protein OnM2_027051 [Erysiphe neolycopersici]|uniref:Uncharacterized protein n=1 Tax=Erysiphe neolycopersici TaxID=212602 RepID=A0A420I0A5_9PEZI|nr:hypothetical protein OnM2_027051 [Erysiphe neolycopersici]
MSTDQNFKTLVEKWRAEYKSTSRNRKNETDRLSASAQEIAMTSRNSNSFIPDSGSITCISGWGTVKVQLKSADKPEGLVLTLINVAYVPTVHTSKASLQLLIEALVSWNAEHKILSFNAWTMATCV